MSLEEPIALRDLRFEVSRRPVDEDERHRFAPDLARLGFDRAVWDVLNATPATGTRHSVPRMLRAYRRAGGDASVGILLFMECRRTARCVTRDPRLEWLLDTVAPPIFAWLRIGAATDGWANPGFVAAGLERDELAAGAIGFLTRRYLYGFVLDAPDHPIGRASADVAFPDFGYLDTNHVTAETLLEASKNLRRKTRKFRNKGGRVQVVRGAMPAGARASVLGWLQRIDPEIRLGFQDNYPAMVEAAAKLREGVHLLAYLDGDFVGSQSFLPTGDRLMCLFGLFDPDRTSNYHAYENIILESVRFAWRQGLRQIDYGPTVNPTKAKMMSRFTPSAIRYCSRVPPVRNTMAWLLGGSRIGPRALGDFIDLETFVRVTPGLARGKGLTWTA